MRGLLIIFLLCVQAYARIVQVDTMEEVMELFQEADSSTLAIFDIDMTLIQPEDPAFQLVNIEKYRPFVKDLITRLPARKRDIFFALTTLGSKSVLVNKQTPQYFARLREQGVRMMALTASLTGPLAHIERMEEWKHEELSTMGINFSDSFTDFFPVELFEKPNYRGNHVIFWEGILFTNGSSCTKGDALVAFLKRAQIHPKEIIFADDKEEHVRNIQEALLSYDPTIEYLGAYFLEALQYPSYILDEEQFQQRWEEVAAQALLLD